ncbi:twin-arginine translocase TatA/TatE family subunit [Streptococcus saliviloxodontae]|uniref:Sec-independent protein translocase protein TatA n=1 Tax=Streptococcus saliviloxodontae TaxID=1349416 RepID=A0ABS2PNW9_9STRE|nr:twin-arginine translocase TatA/TatE family subunit [Streptococcus saliviloxodontae]MBM7636508.1 sec-independent protein translocase protein TatA [Streptococcus saliviloxodontae]
MGFLRDIGLPGVLVIVVAALLIFGPQKLPEVGSSLGKMITEFKKALNGETSKEDKNTEEK